MYDGYQTLKVVREGKIVTVTLNRPAVKNATNAKMHQELMRVFPEIGTDEEAHVVILTGEGDTFSAGGDMSALRFAVDNQPRWMESMREARQILYNVIDLDRPIIAKINGHAIGMGATLASAIRIRSTLLALVFTKPARATFEIACARRVPTLRKYWTQPAVVRGSRM